MSGRLDETSYSDVREKYLSPQSTLSSWNDDNTTYAAVTSLPSGSIEEYVDEVWPELGMPESALRKFLAVRSGYSTNSAIDDSHNQAYEDTNLSAIYYKHLNKERVQLRMQKIVERVVAGENITLVCYEEEGESCHRHILLEELRKMVERRESCRFEFSV